MAIKYYTIPEKKQTIAVLPNTKWDVYNKIDKMMAETGFRFTPNGSNAFKQYMLPDNFKAIVTCDERDEYDVEEGKRQAKKKLMKNYHRSVDKRLAKFKADVAEFAAEFNT